MNALTEPAALVVLFVVLALLCAAVALLVLLVKAAVTPQRLPKGQTIRPRRTPAWTDDDEIAARNHH